MTHRLSLSLAVAALLILAAILIARHPTPPTEEERAASWGQGFQWGNGKFGERR